jgi:hypothetical protein
MPSKGRGLSVVQQHAKKQADQRHRTVNNRRMIVRAWRVGPEYLEGRNPKYPRPGKMTREQMATLLFDDNPSDSWSAPQFDRARAGWPELWPPESWPLTLGMKPPWFANPSLTPPEVALEPMSQAPLLKPADALAMLPPSPPPHRVSYTLNERYEIGSPSDYTCKIVGYRRDEMVGRTAPELFCPGQDRNIGGSGRPFFKAARENPGQHFTYGPIMLQAADGHQIEVLEVDLFWSARGDGCWVIDGIISDAEDARYRMQHPGAQFPDPLDRQHFSDHHALRLAVERGVAGIAAGISSLAFFDGMDGKLDGVIHWCHLLLKTVHSLV